MIEIIIGVIIVFVPYLFFKYKQHEWVNNSDEIIARWLSKDKPPEQYMGGYIIYANKSRWFIDTFCGCRLVWLPESCGDIDAILRSGQLVEFQANWLDKYDMYKLMKKIIYIHPNLTAPNWYWGLIKVLQH